jgi:hypothetical protein
MTKRVFLKHRPGSNRKPSSPSVDWFAHVRDLVHANADALILLDCCSAGGSAGHASRGKKELLAACGFEATAPGPGKHSFTDSLIEELYDLANGPPFTVAQLHDKVSQRLQRWSPYFDADDLSLRDEEGRDIERRNAPVYFSMNSQDNKSSIALRPLTPPSSSRNVDKDHEGIDEPPSKRVKLLAPGGLQGP